MFGPGRFGLGVGTGEALNEHILGDPWPSADIRLEMLEEAVEMIRTLWSGETSDHDGTYYHLEHARVYPLPVGGATPRPRRALLPPRDRADLLPARRAAADPRVGLRPEGDRAGGPY